MEVHRGHKISFELSTAYLQSTHAALKEQEESRCPKLRVIVL